MFRSDSDTDPCVWSDPDTDPGVSDILIILAGLRIRVFQSASDQDTVANR